MPRSETEPDFLTATVVPGGFPPVETGRVERGADEPSPGGSPARMAQHWYIEADGRVEGPLSADELRDRAAAGRLLPTDSVSSDGVQWNTASSVPGLTFPAARRPLVETVVSGSVHQESAPAAPGAVPVVAVRGYQILDPLGIGACGVVHKAFHEGLRRVVALKTLLMPDRASDEMIERFKQEAVALARLQHPNIVAVYDYGECEKPPGQAYIAMELLDGEDLGARVDRAGPLDERTAWLVARQTAAALAHAAKHGIVHRDVKPANLFLVPPPTGFPLPPDVPMVKVTDFGLALARGGSSDGEARQTAAGVLLGTPVYMAPEQFAGSDVDARADIYSLGATVFHVLTGVPPFDGRTVYEVIRKKNGPAPRLAPPVSPATADLVAAMMAAEAAARPADYAQLIARIDALPCLDAFSTTGLPAVSVRMPAAPVLPPAPQPAPAAPPRWGLAARRGRWLYALAAVVLVGAAVGVAAVAGAFNRPAAQPTAPTPDAPTTARTYVAGAAESLYDGRSVLGWAGRGITVEQDGEHKPVLTIPTAATRALKPRANFRLLVALDRYQARTVEVTVAASENPPDAVRWLVRLDEKAGAAFGKQAKGGSFEPLGDPVALPQPKEGQPPYLELRFERVGGVLAAWYDNQPLGNTPDAGLKTTELRVQASGGAARIESAEQVELVEQK